MKKWIALVLVLAMLLSLHASAFADSNESDFITFDSWFVDTIADILTDADAKPEDTAFTRALFAITLFFNVSGEADEVEKAFSLGDLEGGILAVMEEVNIYALYAVSESSDKSMIIMYCFNSGTSIPSVASY